MLRRIKNVTIIIYFSQNGSKGFLSLIYTTMSTKIKSVSPMEAYIEKLNSNCYYNTPCVKKQIKVNEDNMVIPMTNNYNLLFTHNYNLTQLKSIAKIHKLKQQGNKDQLISRIFCFLKLSSYVIKIQKLIRGIIQRKYNRLHGPGFFKREICTNSSDFFTMEDLKEIPHTQFFSYKDNDEFIYGFDIISLHNLISKTEKKKEPLNPYNRNVIPKTVMKNMKTLIRISKLLQIEINIVIKDIYDEMNPQKSLEFRILDVFQKIDSLGNYSDPVWFSSLQRVQLLKFIRELIDIWNYRAQLSVETKRLICPPTGDPFRVLNLINLGLEPDVNKIKTDIIYALEKMVNSGNDSDSQSLGAYYVLGALTLVNYDAANSLPWLYQSVSHI